MKMLINNFKKIYGKPEETIFVLGDDNKGTYHMKGREPVICKIFPRIFKNGGYKTLLINEFRTSKFCNGCNEKLEYYLKRPSQKSYVNRLNIKAK
jgi:hypothetical protein